VSSYANAAFATLVDPIKRAEYLMQVLSRDENGDNHPEEECAILHDADLVERIFELRFTISESTCTDELELLRRALERDLNSDLDKLAKSFRQ